MKKRLTLLVVATFLICVLLAGCNSEPAVTKKTNDTSSTDVANNEGTEPMVITWMGHNQNGIIMEEGSPVQKIIEDRFNVKIEIIPIDIQSAEAVSLYWNSGAKAPDHIANFGTDPLELLQEQGLIRSVSTDMLYQNMPKWMENLETLVTQGVVDEQLEYEDGRVYGIPFKNASWMQSGLMPLREDWLDNVSLEIPKTLDEMHDVLYAFTHKDPDGNGLDDTYGLHPGGRYNAHYVFGAYGIQKDSLYKSDDNTVWYTSASQQYKDALITLNNWYEEGLIDPEFVTDDRTAQRQKWSDGKVGMIGDNAYWLSSNLGSKSVIAMVEDKNPDAKIGIFAPVTGPEGLSGAHLDYPTIWGQGALFFGRDTSDEKVAKIMEIKETFVTDRELYLRCFYGAEGSEYTMDGDILVINPSLTAEDITKAGVDQYFARIPATWDDMSMTFADERDILINKSTLEQPFSYKGTAFSIDEVNEVYNAKMVDVRTIVEKFYFDAITGKVDIESEWDSYIDQINKAGLTQIIDEFNSLVG